jgi:hypothetical protein
VVDQDHDGVVRIVHKEILESPHKSMGLSKSLSARTPERTLLWKIITN